MHIRKGGDLALKIFEFHRPPTADDLEKPTDKRMLALARGMYYSDFDLEEAHALTAIDGWFLFRMQNIVDIYHRLEKEDVTTVTGELLLEAKQAGVSDRQLAKKIGSNEYTVRQARFAKGITPCVKQIDTVAGEWPTQTNYLYTTFIRVEDDVRFNMKNAVMVLGSGVYRIGSSVEFHLSCVVWIRELKPEETSVFGGFILFVAIFMT
ncbi:Protein CBG25505 [Caenorhabditis briggsae]|uniref:Protein CBG25505 n=1 Tax=Caenorhabditis briggsae TaxID=6238 RepID=B6IEP5_CAEBR|nr:Protein CBG25505 [Caenorhabditis briggsae]CAR98375.1 Protein CBG25505 [Caenorhabditis briggsae]